MEGGGFRVGCGRVRVESVELGVRVWGLVWGLGAGESGDGLWGHRLIEGVGVGGRGLGVSDSLKDTCCTCLIEG